MAGQRMLRLTSRRVVRALKRGGWTAVRTAGSHVQLRHPKRGGLVTVPMHATETVGPGLLKSILEQADLTAEELKEWL